MAWVRIHDGAMTNVKIATLSDAAFRLWVMGLCYCQTALTDGLIPREALKQMRATRSAITELSTSRLPERAPLWEPPVVGFKVHDYLAWNDSRERVLEKRADAKMRAHVSRENRARARHEPRTLPSGVVLDPKSSEVTEGECEGKPPKPKGHRRHAYCGARFCVPDFLHERFSNQLGEKGLARFDLLAWYPALDEDSTGPIPGDVLTWVQQQFSAASKRALQRPAPRAEWHCPHVDKPCGSERVCGNLVALEEARKASTV